VKGEFTVAINTRSSWRSLREVVIVLLALTLVSFGTLLALIRAPVSQAASSRLDTSGCTVECLAGETWGGTIGIESRVYVLSGADFKCGNCDGTNTWVENVIYLNGGGTGYMEMGYVNPTVGGGENYFDTCFVYSGGCNYQHYLFPVFGSREWTDLTIENTDAGGGSYTFIASGIGTDTTTDGLTKSQIHGLDDLQIFSAGSAQNIYTIKAYFTYNGWQSAVAPYGFSYQQNDGTGLTNSSPPYAGWEDGQDPLHSTTGGDLWAECDNTACS
jgi:hypothetical protein